ncbi:MAG: hypothetical protein MJE63_31645 [Proteobacteria bacterium]|nr:hypothetical protein [Pseudomonadota bacterium]
MKKTLMMLISCVLLVINLEVYADLTGTQKIRDHVDFKLKDVNIDNLSPAEKKAWLVDPVRLNLNMLIPIYGSTILDNTLYGNIRPPAYIFDWTLGGFLPMGCLLAVGLGGDNLSDDEKKDLVATAVGLYVLTRIGVFITINEHIYQYNKYMKIRLGLDNEELTDISMSFGYERTF